MKKVIIYLLLMINLSNAKMNIRIDVTTVQKDGLLLSMSDDNLWEVTDSYTVGDKLLTVFNTNGTSSIYDDEIISTLPYQVGQVY